LFDKGSYLTASYFTGNDCASIKCFIQLFCPNFTFIVKEHINDDGIFESWGRTVE